MKKNVYIFNCNGNFDASYASEIYYWVKEITGIECEKYSFVFKRTGGKFSSRSGTVKNMKNNILKYLSNSDYALSFNTLEMYDAPDDATYLDVDKRRFGFFIKQWEKDMFNVYIVLPYSLNERQILDIWAEFSKQYSANYMVYYDFESSKDVEICMYGVPIVRGLETTEEYYSKDEYKIVYKLYYLRTNKTYELEDVFPICIITKGYSINEQSYRSKTNIGLDAYLFTK